MLVAMETPRSAKFEHQSEKKMADSRFALSNRNIVEKLKENAKNKNTLKATQTWLNVWQTWTTERKLKTQNWKNTSTNNSIKCCKSSTQKYVLKTGLSTSLRV